MSGLKWAHNQAGTDVYEDVGGDPVASVVGKGFQNEKRLNRARLIAAAPDLLEALDGLLAQVDHAAMTDGWSDYGEREAARAAISRATGHSSLQGVENEG